MVYAVLGAIVIGRSLGVFGSGGSILTVPVLLYLMHHEDKVAIAESLAIVGGVALVSVVPYAVGRLVDWRSTVLFGLPGMAGTYAGAWAAGLVAGFVQLLVFAGVMLLAALMTWRGTAGTSAGAGVAAPRGAAAIALDGLLVGALTGFVGVGGGFLIVPALVLLGGLSMRRAVGTSLMIIAMKSATGFVKYLRVLEQRDLAVDWKTIAVFIGVGAVGSLAGRGLNARIDQRALQKVFSVFLLLMARFILAREGASIPTDDAGEPSAVPATATTTDPTPWHEPNGDDDHD